MKVFRIFSTLVLVAMSVTMVIGCGGGGGRSGTDTTNPATTTNPTTSSTASYNVSGAITSSNGGMQSVTVTLTTPDGTSPSTVTDANGRYSFSGLSNGSYTVTPSETGASFVPATMPVAINGADSTGDNFTGALGFSISGIVTFVTGNNAKQAVELTLSGPSSASASPDANGNYSFLGLANGVYTVTASMPDYPNPFANGIPACGTLIYSLAPSQMTVTIDNTNSTGNNVTEKYAAYQGSCGH